MLPFTVRDSLLHFIWQAKSMVWGWGWVHLLLLFLLVIGEYSVQMCTWVYVCIYRCVCIHTLRNFCFLLLLFLLLHFRVVICHQVVKLQGQSVSFQNFGRHCQIISLFSLSRWYQWTSTPYQMRRGAYFFHSLINTKYLKYSCLLIRWVKMVI